MRVAARQTSFPGAGRSSLWRAAHPATRNVRCRRYAREPPCPPPQAGLRLASAHAGPCAVTDPAFERARPGFAGNRVLDRERVRILPCDTRVAPFVARRKGQLLAHAAGVDAPDGDLVVAALRAKIRRREPVAPGCE